MEAPLHPEEDKRLAAVRQYDVLDTTPEVAYDRITSLAARLFDAPIALVSLLDDRRQWFKSTCGLTVKETPRELAFCAHAILNRGVMVVANAAADPRFAENPLVTGGPEIRFYAGAPLITPEGLPLGTLCIIDTVERKSLTEGELETLLDLAAVVVDELEFRKSAKSLLDLNEQLKQRATQDVLTALPNRERFELDLDVAVQRCRGSREQFGVLFVDLDGFKPVNDTLGHAAGDALLRETGERLKSKLPENATLARVGGDEFVVLVRSLPAGGADALAEAMCRVLAPRFMIEGHEATVTASIGIAIFPDDAENAADLVRVADAAMYEAKRCGGNGFKRAESRSHATA